MRALAGHLYLKEQREKCKVLLEELRVPEGQNSEKIFYRADKTNYGLSDEPHLRRFSLESKDCNGHAVLKNICCSAFSHGSITKDGPVL